MPSKSKNKGSSFERQLGKILESVFGGKFVRTANSGAFVGGTNASRKEGLSRAQLSGAKGDLQPPDHMPKLVIEAKAYKEFRFHQLLAPEPMPQLETWIKQAVDAVDPGDVWLICFKVDRLGTYAFIPNQGIDGLVYRSHGIYTGTIGGVITDLDTFLADNRDRLLEVSGWAKPTL